MIEAQFPEAFTSSVPGLGALKRYFPVKNIRRGGNLVNFFLFLLGAAAVFLWGVYDTSTAYQVDPFFPTLPAQPVNFRVFNTSENRQIDFAFLKWIVWDYPRQSRGMVLAHLAGCGNCSRLK